MDAFYRDLYTNMGLYSTHELTVPEGADQVQLEQPKKTATQDIGQQPVTTGTKRNMFLSVAVLFGLLWAFNIF